MNLRRTVNKKNRLQVQLRNIRENPSKPFLSKWLATVGKKNPLFLRGRDLWKVEEWEGKRRAQESKQDTNYCKEWMRGRSKHISCYQTQGSFQSSETCKPSAPVKLAFDGKLSKRCPWPLMKLCLIIKSKLTWLLILKDTQAQARESYKTIVSHTIKGPETAKTLKNTLPSAQRTKSGV